MTENLVNGNEVKTKEKEIVRNEKEKIKDNFKDLEALKKYINGNSPSEFKENFELLKFVGSGGSGIFYEGKCLKGNKQKIGMKFLIKQKNGLKIQAMNDEVKILRKLHHKNVISIYGNYKLDNEGNSCAILELAELGDLISFRKNIVKKKYFSETLLNYLTKKILDGLNIFMKIRSYIQI